MKTIDQTYYCQLPGQMSGTWQLQCHLCIFQSRSEVQTVTSTDTVMITDMGFEMGWFIPYLIETLVNQIVSEFDLNPEKLVWIEHYSSDYRELNATDFSQVTFDWQNGKATNPQWTAITHRAVQELINEDSPLIPVQR